MKKISLAIFGFLIILVISVVAILSTTGITTVKLNKPISNKINEKNPNLSVKIKKIKFKFDLKSLNLYLETSIPEVNYKNLDIPINQVKAYLDIVSLIKSKPKINKVLLSTDEVNIETLKKIILKIKPTSFNSIIINKIKKGKLYLNLELYFNDELTLNNYIAKGEVKEMSGKINEKFMINDAYFNFFADKSDTLIKNINFDLKGIKIKDGNIQVERDQKINIKSNFFSEITINKINNKDYLAFLKKINLINENIELKANVDHFITGSFDKTFKLVNYVYTNKGKINELSLSLDKSIISTFLEKKIDNFHLKSSNVKVRHSSDKKNFINLDGMYSFDKKSFQKFNYNNNFSKANNSIELKIEFLDKLKLGLINYKKDQNKVAEVNFKANIKGDSVNIDALKYSENKNIIEIEKLKINKKNFISLKSIKIKTFDNNILNNDFEVKFGKKINIKGKKFDARQLNKYFSSNTKNKFFQNLNNEIEIDLRNIETVLSKKLNNFRLIGIIEKGKFTKISSKGDFGNNKFLDISMKNDKKNKKKFLEIYSDIPQPLLSEYSFFKGLSGGTLTFSSIIEEDKSESKLIIEDFKVINAPGLVKLLSLADFGGLADLAEGDGLSFEKLEIDMSNERKFIKLNELFADGSSLSVLMEGYKDENDLTSLRGTLVPAKNLNKILAKIPLIGKIIIPQEVGEGLFGVSFKMKGKPGKIKTTINPIKTLTPRFITRALEKQKKTK